MLPVPKYWVRPPRGLSKAAGMHRFLWDMHYAPTPGARANYPMQAIFQDTAPAQTSYWVMPGNYTVKLTVNGKSYTQPLAVKMDPRVKTPLTGLTQQFTLSKQCYDDVVASSKAIDQTRAVRAQLGKVKDRAGAAAEAIAAFDQKAGALAGNAGGGRGGRGAVAAGPDTLASVSGALNTLLRLLQGADTAPTTQAAAAVADRRVALAKLMQTWTILKSRDLAAINVQLKQASLPEVTLE